MSYKECPKLVVLWAGVVQQYNV